MTTVGEVSTQQTLSPLAEWFSAYGIDLLVIFVVTGLLYTTGSMIIGYLVKKAVTGARQRTLHRKDVEKRQKTLVGLFTNLWRIVVVVVGVFFILKQFFDTLSLAPLFASAGIVGVALGFGAQSLVKDFLSGIFIISENQYRVGDIIDIEGNGGTVERIGVRSTVIRDVDGNVHYFPNGMVQHVINKTMGFSMARFSIGVHPSSDLEVIISLINRVGEKLANDPKWQAKIIDAPTFQSVGEFTQSNVSLLISGKTQPSDQWSVIAEMRQRLLLELDNQSIQLGATALTVPVQK